MQTAHDVSHPSICRRGYSYSAIILHGHCLNWLRWFGGSAASCSRIVQHCTSQAAAMANADEVVTLFVSNLPSELQPSEFTRLFSQLDGCVGSRIRKDKNGKYVPSQAREKRRTPAWRRMERRMRSNATSRCGEDADDGCTQGMSDSWTFRTTLRP